MRVDALGCLWPDSINALEVDRQVMAIAWERMPQFTAKHMQGHLHNKDKPEYAQTRSGDNAAGRAR